MHLQLQAEPSGLDHPFHELRVGPAERTPWMNPTPTYANNNNNNSNSNGTNQTTSHQQNPPKTNIPQPTPPSLINGVVSRPLPLQPVPTSTTSGAPSSKNQFGQSPPALLSAHLHVVTQMQTQLAMFKFQMRQMLEGFVKLSAAVEESNAAAPTPASTPTPAQLLAMQKEVRDTMFTMYNNQCAILTPLIGHTDKYPVHGRTLARKDMFGTEVTEDTESGCCGAAED